MKHLSSFALLTLIIAISLLSYSCGNKKVLTSAQLNAIRINHVPSSMPNNDSWDPGAGLPDIQIKITLNKVNIYTSEVYDDASAKNTYIFKRSTPFLFEDMESEYRVDVYDFDSFSSDEWIGGFTFQPSDFKDQKEILLESNTTPIVISLLTDWNYIKKKSMKTARK